MAHAGQRAGFIDQFHDPAAVHIAQQLLACSGCINWAMVIFEALTGLLVFVQSWSW
jgi:hypothetical protein